MIKIYLSLRNNGFYTKRKLEKSIRSLFENHFIVDGEKLHKVEIELT